MIASANISDKSIHPQEGSNKQNSSSLLPFRLHPHANIAITWSSLVVLKNGLHHLVPHVILHLVIYRLLIFFKMADDTMMTEFDFLI